MHAKRPWLQNKCLHACYAMLCYAPMLPTHKFATICSASIANNRDSWIKSLHANIVTSWHMLSSHDENHWLINVQFARLTIANTWKQNLSSSWFNTHLSSSWSNTHLSSSWSNSHLSSSWSNSHLSSSWSNSHLSSSCSNSHLWSSWSNSHLSSSWSN
jgi:hypothetical protein